MALLNEQQTNLLTFPGFIGQFENYWLNEGLPQPKAFEETNRDVKLIAGEERYGNDQFDVFITNYKRRRTQQNAKRQG